MEYRRLGHSGLKIREIGLGENYFGWYADEQTSIDVIHCAPDLGVNYIDSADLYDRGTSDTFNHSVLYQGRPPQETVCPYP